MQKILKGIRRKNQIEPKFGKSNEYLSNATKGI